MCQVVQIRKRGRLGEGEKERKGEREKGRESERGR